MRILFTTWAWPSHLYAMVPVAWACKTAGHDVVVASPPALTDTILRTGLPAAPIGRDVDALPTFRDIVFNPPGPNGGGPRVLSLFATLADAMVDDLARVARRWQADVVVFEPTTLAGPVAAAAAGVPAVRHLFGTDLLSAAGRFLPPILGPLAQRFGLDEVNPFGAMTVDPCPTALQVPVGSRQVPIRYTPFNGSGLMPPELPARSGRPRVCVTWGTTMGRLHPELFLAGEVVRAIGHLDLEVVVAITAEQRQLLGPVPPGVHIVTSAPLHLVLPSCDAVLAHGGAGTMLTALSYGLPQLLLPRLSDHVRHATRLRQSGAGIVVPAIEASAAVISAQLTELLTTPSYREAAERIQRELASRPSPRHVVDELQLLAEGAAAPAG